LLLLLLKLLLLPSEVFELHLLLVLVPSCRDLVAIFVDVLLLLVLFLVEVAAKEIALTQLFLLIVV